MKNITLSNQDYKIDELRRMAAQNNTTINQLFRDWADEYLAKQRAARLKALNKTLQRTSYVKLDRKYTRAEMNER